MNKKEKLENLTYELFKDLARDQSLSKAEKIGFYDSLRTGQSAAILADLKTKIPALKEEKRMVIDIGCGCGELLEALSDLAAEQKHQLVLNDSSEMLANVADKPYQKKIAGKFPSESLAALKDEVGQADVILVYSVFHYVFQEGQQQPFIEALLALLAPGGQLLIGDIPNVSMRNRFFSSEAGLKFHAKNTGSSEPPVLAHEQGEINDQTLLDIIKTCRKQGYHAYIVPQGAELPMANRREDLLIIRP